MIFVHPKSLAKRLFYKLKSMNALDDICTPEITAKRLEKTSKRIFYIFFPCFSTVLSVLHDHLCKMLIAAPPGIGFFSYKQKMLHTRIKLYTIRIQRDIGVTEVELCDLDSVQYSLLSTSNISRRRSTHELTFM